MPSQQLGHFNLGQSIFAHQRMHDPGFFDLSCPASRAVQPVNRRLRAPFIRLRSAAPQPIHRLQFPRGSQPLESVNELLAALLKNTTIGESCP